MAQPILQDINDKLDQLLKYQKRQCMWAWIKSIIWLVTFIIFVGLPSYFVYDIFSNPNKYLDLSELKSYRQQIEQLMKQFQR